MLRSFPFNTIASVVGPIIIPNLYVMKTEAQIIKWFTCGHPTSKWQNQDSSTNSQYIIVVSSQYTIFPPEGKIQKAEIKICFNSFFFRINTKVFTTINKTLYYLPSSLTSPLKHTCASGTLNWLCLLPGNLLPKTSPWMIPSPLFSHCSKLTFSKRPVPPLFKIATHNVTPRSWPPFLLIAIILITYHIAYY